MTASTDTATERLPTRSPLVTATHRLPIDPCIALQASDESDVHHDALTELPPSRDSPLGDSTLKPTPINVTLPDPVPAMLERCPNPWTLVSREKAEDTLPTTRLTVTDKRRLLRSPCPNWHRTAVSDAHIVASQPERPARAAMLSVSSPAPRPLIVTMTEPIPTTLDCRTLLA